MHAEAVFTPVDLGVVELIAHGKAPKHIFDHDHGAIDDDAEIHRAQRQQVGRNADESEADKCRQEGQRDYDRHDRRCAKITEKQVQDQRHQRGALDQVLEHRVERLADQPGTVVERHDRHALGQA